MIVKMFSSQHETSYSSDGKDVDVEKLKDSGILDSIDKLNESRR